MAQKRPASLSSEDDNGIFTYGNQMELNFGVRKRFKSKPPDISSSSSSETESSDEDNASGLDRWKRTHVNVDDSDNDEYPNTLMDSRNPNGSIENLEPPLPPPPPPAYITGLSIKQSETLRNIRDIESNLRRAQSESSASPSPSMHQQRKDDFMMSPPMREIAVKIRCHGVVEKYKIVKNEPFSTVIKNIAFKENVEPSRIRLSLKGYSIKQSDTPSDIKITIADIIECVILRGMIDIEDDIDNNKMTIRIQSTNNHSRKEYTVSKVVPLKIALEMYCTDQKLDISKIQVSFDGDSIDLSQSPDEIELENLDILDVRLTS